MKTIDNRIARTIVFVVSLVMSIPVFGQNADAVDLRLASRVGENFIRLNGHIALSGEPGSLRRVETDKFPNLYIFNADDIGFIIVAGDKRVQPILGFSDEGTFDPNDMAPAAEMIIGSYDYVVDSMVRYNVRSTDESVRQAWIDLENGYYREEKGNREDEPQYPLAICPLIRTKWGQGKPYPILSPNGWRGNYNQLCPWFDFNNNGVVDETIDRRAITGCVATAMAQLLYYFKVCMPNQTTIYSKYFLSECYRTTNPTSFQQSFPVLNNSGSQVYENGHPLFDVFYMLYIDDYSYVSQGFPEPKHYNLYNNNYEPHLYNIGNWDYSKSTNSRELAAKMMLDCGLSVDTQWGGLGDRESKGSSAYSLKYDEYPYLSYALKSFQEVFGFSEAVGYWKSRRSDWWSDNGFGIYHPFISDNTINNAWKKILKKYICQEVPLFYRGYGRNVFNHNEIQYGGHAYILDGYITDTYDTFFHHNLGWEGDNNAYYSIDYLFPSTQCFIGLVPVKDSDIHIVRTINFGEDCPINDICGKNYLVKYGGAMSVTNNYTFNNIEYAKCIVYTQSGEYRMYDKSNDGTNIFINVLVKPNGANDVTINDNICRGHSYTKKFPVPGLLGKYYMFTLPPGTTDYEGMRTFYQYVTNDIDGSIIGRCILNLTTKDCDPDCTPDVSGLNSSKGVRDSQTTNQIIYESVTKYYEYMHSMKGFLSQTLMEAYWFDEEKGIEFWNLFQSLLDSNTGLISEEGIQQLISQSQLDNISDDYIRVIAERYNQSVLYWNEGYYSNDSLPEGYGGVIEYDTAAMRKAYEAQAYAESLGFSDVRQMYDNAYEMLETEIENIQSSVCARVTVQFNQKMTMTREAFNGTLQIFNGHESIPMEDIFVDFRIEDQQGNDCTDLFQINTLSLDQITGISGDGSLAAQTNGTALVQFIPTKNAAPTQPVVYSFGGSFSFIDPFTGEGLTYPLYPVEITVNPSPDLYVDYFMQRDILGDDALTLDKVEPSIPAELGVIINNKGAGTAKNVILETAEPQIIDNDKGLAIDFEMYGASFNGSPRQLGLMEIPFGNIESGHTAVGEWLFTSTLLGHFVSYEAHVIHNSSYGNSDLSLVSHLDIHELIHPIYAYGNLDDGINDFLVNDNSDAYDMPDSIYFSHGGRTAVGIVDDISYDHVVTPLDTIVTLTINPSRIGWNYGVTSDPGVNKYDIVSCTRNIDNQEIPLSNVWQTFVTIPDGGDPVYENKLHIVDTLSNDVQNFTYTLVYSLKTNLLDIEEISGIPESYIDYPLESFTVRFNEAIIDSTFTYEDMTLKCQNGPNLMDESVVITKVDETIYNVNISNITNETGLFVLNVNTLNICDTRGYGGYNGKQASWVQALTNDTVYISGDQAVCESVDFAPLTSTVEGNVVSYQWQLNGIDIEGANDMTYQPTTGGVYSLTVTFVNGNVITSNEVILLTHQIHEIPITAEICFGEDYIENGFNIIEPEVGTHNETLNLQSVHGCDSIVNLSLVVHPLYEISLSAEICEGEDYTENGFNIIAPEVGIHNETLNLQSIHGCDSIVNLALVVHPLYETSLSAEICFGENYTLNGFNLIAPEVGTHNETLNLQSVHGCDSIVNLALVVHPLYETSLSAEICFGEDYTLNGFNIIAPEVGTHNETLNLQSVHGCDSIVSLTLTVNPVFNTEITAEICEGEDYTENGFNLIAPEVGIHNETLNFQTIHSCDSIVSLTLTVIANPVVTIEGDTLVTSGSSVTLTASGADNYEWSTGETTSVIVVTPDETTTYSVTGFNEYDCSSDAFITVFVVTGTGEEYLTIPVKIYPNPTHNSLIVEGENMSSITIMNSLGVTIHKITGINKVKCPVKMTNYPSGIYYLKITTRDGETIHKVVKY